MCLQVAGYSGGEHKLSRMVAAAARAHELPATALTVLRAVGAAEWHAGRTAVSAALFGTAPQQLSAVLEALSAHVQAGLESSAGTLSLPPQPDAEVSLMLQSPSISCPSSLELYVKLQQLGDCTLAAQASAALQLLINSPSPPSLHMLAACVSALERVVAVKSAAGLPQFITNVQTGMQGQSDARQAHDANLCLARLGARLCM